MTEFKEIQLSDKEWVDKIVFKEDSPSADFNFPNLYVWDKVFQQLICKHEDRMLTELIHEGENVFSFPIGTGPLRPAIEFMREHAGNKNNSLIIKSITEKHREILEVEYPGQFEYSEDPGLNDYVYFVEKLATYPGRSLHGKKNCCNRFQAANDWDFVPFTKDFIPECELMLDRWFSENAERVDDGIVNERRAMRRAFDAFDELKLEGGVLRSSGTIVAFTLGTIINHDTYDVMFEKALMSYDGSYPMVCREMCRMLMAKYPHIKYTNREDDMGLEYLRMSKMSYKPEYILSKYIARWKND